MLIDNTKNVVIDRLNRLKDEIVGNIESNGITASGRTQRSFEVVEYDGGVRLIAKAGDRAPIPTLEVGREGGKIPKGFYLILAQWSRDKGLSFSSERERMTFAYFLSKRIAQEGTLRARQPVDVYGTATKKAASDIKEMMFASVKQQIMSIF